MNSYKVYFEECGVYKLRVQKIVSASSREEALNKVKAFITRDIKHNSIIETEKHNEDHSIKQIKSYFNSPIKPSSSF